MISRFLAGCSLGVFATVAMSGAAFAAPLAQQADAAQSKKAKTKKVKKQKKAPGQDTSDAPESAAATKDRAALSGAVTEGSKVTDDGVASDIVVVGIRGSIDSALSRKRDSKQVVDSIVAEDAGKLPDNTVGEAIARIPGVNITRSAGGADGFTIRGLAGVQTTVNGQDVSGGDGRAISLSDIPAELIKSVDVYKSRGANQPEGGIGGTVNVELRRPLELKKGWLIAGSVRGVYDDQTRRVTPSGSLLASYRFDTGLGEMGLLVNGAYSRTRYAETLVQNESPDHFFNDALASLPANIRATAVAPYRIQYGLNSGDRTQKSLSVTYQWKPSEHLSFVLEGQYFGERYHDRYAGLSLNTRNDNEILSNIVTGSSGAIVKATYTVATGLPVYTFGGTNYGDNHTLIGNFEAHWSGGIARIDFSANYQDYNGNSRGVNFGQQYRQATTANVNFNDQIVPGGIPTFTLPGVDLADPASGRLNNVGDRANIDSTKNLVLQMDGSLRLSDTGFFRELQLGTRYSYRRQQLQYGYRNVRFDNPNGPFPPLSALGAPIQVLTPKILGHAPITFATMDPEYIFDNWAKLRSVVLGLKPAGFDGNGPSDSVASFLAADSPSFDPQQGGTYIENNFAAYAQLNWATSGKLRAEGQFGLRYVNVFGSTIGSRLILPPDANGNCCGEAYLEDNNSRANSIDLLPSASSVWHWTSKFQSRFTYNYNVQRPSFYSLRSTYIIVNPANPNETVYRGNPDLKPVRDHNFNLTMEWYPRSGMSFTAGAFYKKQTGFIYYTYRFEPVPALAGAIRKVYTDRNAGPGKVLGFEFATTIPFSAVSNSLRGFGITANTTWIPVSTIDVPDETGGNFVTIGSAYTSRLTSNIILFYETTKLSGRLAYNMRSSFRTSNDVINPQWNQDGLPQRRLDAAINYTPVPFMTLSIEGTNLLHNVDRYRYDLYPDLSVGVRSMARTIQGSVRFRF